MPARSRKEDNKMLDIKRIRQNPTMLLKDN